jgi:uncharacterized membrane protein YgcG
MTSAIAAIIALVLAVIATATRAVRWRDHPGRGIIVAEYEPPAGISLMEAADLVGASSKGITATILAEAVAGRLRVVETGRKTYAVEVAGAVGTPDRDATSVARALFGPVPVVGSRRSLKSRDTALGTKLMNLRRQVHARVAKEGLRRRPDGGRRVLLAFGAIAAATIAVVFGFLALDDRMGGLWPLLPIAGSVAAGLATVLVVANVRPLTERGRLLHDHLEGLREYIRLAEADRIRMLQSPSGAERAPLVAAMPAGAVAGGPDPEQVLRVTERLLPYAVLFGHEREWSDELATLYAARGEQPGWYSGRDGFNAVAFSAGVSSFTSASSSSWSGSASSSSSGGSGGGGSSGGGGGGGGGGGV